MSGWKEVYETGAFAITTDQPSDIVRKYAGLIPDGSRVADLGCGAGRNSLFLSGLDHSVDAFDIVDLDWLKNLSPEHLERVHFNQQAVEGIELEGRSLGAVLLIRLIQYLPEEQVSRLVTNAQSALVDGGILFMNYTASGGIHDIPQLEVPKYSHPFDKVIDIVASAGLRVIYAQEADMPSLHTNLDSDYVHACDLVAQR